MNCGSTSLPTVLVDKAAMQALTERVCCLEGRTYELEQKDCGTSTPEAPCNLTCSNIAFFADSGEQNDSKQIDLWNRIQTRSPDFLLMGGDNTYTNPGDCDSVQLDQEIFAPYRNAGTLFPAIGNHDLDVDPGSLCHYNLYPYLPGNRRYYTVKLEDRGIQLFVLNSGLDSGLTLREPDGNSLGSVQYRWFIKEAAKSTAKWKIVMFHHPWFSQVSGAANGSSYLNELDWRFENYGIDLVINGHSHVSTHHNARGVDYIQASVSVRDPRSLSTNPSPSGIDIATLVWKDDRNGTTGDPVTGFIEATERALKVEFVDTITGEVLHCFAKMNDRQHLCEQTEDVNCASSHVSYSSF